MRLSVTTFQTLDGVMQAPGGPDEDHSSGFEHGGWGVPHMDAEFGAFMDETFERAGGFLLGRRTYEIFASYWPHVEQEDAVSRGLNTLPKHVASTTLSGPLDWSGSSVLGGGDELPGRIRELKASGGDGELQVHGSAGLLQTLFAHGLVDELRLLTFPVVLGTGKRLFEGGAMPTALRLTESRTTTNGIAITVYENAGRPEYGAVELDTEAAG